MIRLRQQCSAITFHMWKVQNVLEKQDPSFGSAKWPCGLSISPIWETWFIRVSVAQVVPNGGGSVSSLSESDGVPVWSLSQVTLL